MFLAAFKERFPRFHCQGKNICIIELANLLSDSSERPKTLFRPFVQRPRFSANKCDKWGIKTVKIYRTLLTARLLLDLIFRGYSALLWLREYSFKDTPIPVWGMRVTLFQYIPYIYFVFFFKIIIISNMNVNCREATFHSYLLVYLENWPQHEFRCSLFYFYTENIWNSGSPEAELFQQTKTFDR